MSEPTIAVYVSTLGASTLPRLLDSIATQRLIPGDQVMVVVDRKVDGGGGPADGLTWPSGAPARCVCDGSEEPTICPTCLTVAAFNRTAPLPIFGAVHHEDHCWGHPQRNWLLDREVFSADLIVGNDDDDAFNPGAFDALRARAAEHPGRVLLFRFVTWQRNVLPSPGVAKECHIGGHSIVVPNEPALIGRWGRRYAGDWDFIDSTLRLHRVAGREPVWCPEVISTARPGEPGQLRNAHDLRRGSPGPASRAVVVVSRSDYRLGATLERLMAEQQAGDEVVVICDGEQTPAVSAAVDLSARGLSVFVAELPRAPEDQLRAAGAAIARAPHVVHASEAG